MLRNREPRIQILGVADVQLGTASSWLEDYWGFNGHGTSVDTDTMAYAYDYGELIMIYECV